MKLRIFWDAIDTINRVGEAAAGVAKEVGKAVIVVFQWASFVLVVSVAGIGLLTAVFGFLFELLLFLRYGRWIRGIEFLNVIASFIDDEADIFAWVMGLNWAGVKWLLLHWPLSALGLGAGLVMLLLSFIIAAWMKD